MEPAGVERRLAAILSADIVGFGRLMRADEVGTLAALNAHRAETVDPEIARHRGRIVKTTGDGVLVEFASVVDALQCAIAIQDQMRVRNADTPADRRLDFRIGVNLGDIIVQKDDIFGDGVNLAARLQALADAGGVAISRDVYRQVEAKLAFRYEDLGERRVKDGEQPVRAYRVLSPQEVGPTETVSRPSLSTRRRWAVAASFLVILAIGAFAAWSRFGGLAGPPAEAECLDHLGLPVPARECEERANQENQRASPRP